MSRSSSQKRERQSTLKEKIEKDPFLTDEEIARMFSVSVPTVRLDRLELGIPELRERIKNFAEKNFEKVKSMQLSEFVGELVDIELGKRGISILETNDIMAFEKNKIVKGQYIYSLAESLAIAVIDADVALVGVANIKYSKPVYSGSKIVAKAQVIRERASNFLVWVKVYEQQAEVFRGKFILVTIN